MGSRPSWVKPITMQLVFVASLLSMQLKGVRTKTGCHGIRIMCLSGV